MSSDSTPRLRIADLLEGSLEDTYRQAKYVVGAIQDAMRYRHLRDVLDADQRRMLFQREFPALDLDAWLDADIEDDRSRRKRGAKVET